jgi:hypothetical protein
LVEGDDPGPDQAAKQPQDPVLGQLQLGRQLSRSPRAGRQRSRNAEAQGDINQLKLPE